MASVWPSISTLRVGFSWRRWAASSSTRRPSGVRRERGNSKCAGCSTKGSPRRSGGGGGGRWGGRRRRGRRRRGHGPGEGVAHPGDDAVVEVLPARIRERVVQVHLPGGM